MPKKKNIYDKDWFRSHDSDEILPFAEQEFTQHVGPRLRNEVIDEENNLRELGKLVTHEKIQPRSMPGYVQSEPTTYLEDFMNSGYGKYGLGAAGIGASLYGLYKLYNFIKNRQTSTQQNNNNNNNNNNSRNNVYVPQVKLPAHKNKRKR